MSRHLNEVWFPILGNLSYEFKWRLLSLVLRSVDAIPPDLPTPLYAVVSIIEELSTFLFDRSSVFDPRINAVNAFPAAVGEF